MNDVTAQALADLRAAGQSPTEAADALAQDLRFAQIVDRNALRHLLAVHPTLLIRMQDMRAADAVLVPDPEMNLQLRNGLALVLNTAQWDTGILDLVQAQHAAQYRGLLAAFQGLGKLDTAEVEAFLALGGGYLVEHLSAEDIQAHWDTLDRTTAADQSLVRVQAAVQAQVTQLRTQEAMALALRDEIAAGADHLAELAALADALEG